MRRLVIIFIATLAMFAALINAKPTTNRPAGAITAYPIPQRPPYAPNPWVYPKPTVEPIHQ